MLNADHILNPMIDKLSQRALLGADERDAMLSLRHRVVSIDRHGAIARAGDAMPNCFVLLSGSVFCNRLVGDGARQITSVHFAGDLLGVQAGKGDALLSNIQPLTSVTVAYIVRADLLFLATRFPLIAAALSADAAGNMSILSEWLVSLGRRNARSRVAHLVCELALRQESASICDGPDYRWWLTQEQIADATGLTPVHVNRTMQLLRQEGLIRTTPRQLTVLDWKGLRAAGDFNPEYLQLGRREAAAPVPQAFTEIAQRSYA